MKMDTNELKAVVSAGRLLQYCQLMVKNFRDISLHIWKFSQYLNLYQFILQFSAESWMGKAG